MKAMVMTLLVAAGCSKSLAEETKGKAESLKAKACGCAKGDGACLDKVAAEHDPWSEGLDQRLNGKVTQEEYYAITNVEDAYRACVAERR